MGKIFRELLILAMMAEFASLASAQPANAPTTSQAVAAMHDPKLTPEQRQAAAATLAQTPDGVAALLAALKESDPDVRFSVAEGLMRIPPGTSALDIRAPIVQAMLPLQKHADVQVRMRALQWLENGNGGRAPDNAYITAMGDTDPLIRRAAADMAGRSQQMPSAKLLLALAGATAAEADSEARQRGIQSLSRLTNQAPHEAVVIRRESLVLMDSSTPADRIAGLLAAGTMFQPDAAIYAAVSKLITDAEKSVRSQAETLVIAWASSRGTVPEVAQLAITAAADDSAAVASHITADENLRQSVWAPQVTQRFNASTGEIKQRLGKILAAMGETGSASTQQLAEGLTSTDPARRKLARDALLACSAQADALEAVLAALAVEDLALRRELVDAVVQRFFRTITSFNHDGAAEMAWREKIMAATGAARVAVYKQMGEQVKTLGPAIGFLAEAAYAAGYSPEERAAAIDSLRKIARFAMSTEHE